ncbi:hypothetical protein L1049_018837 [Liquidambar formosana]|uniref:Uncharacterized protein n=1 Tax=Liquidambar formosana TaxID=63359 RepID=A0AAP0RAP7_LIQFO
MSETGAGSPFDVDGTPQIFPSDRSPSHERGICKFFFSKPYLIAFSFLITFLIGVLQVTNKNNDASSFATHPANMRVFIIATVIYSFAFATTLSLPPDTSSSLLAGFVAFFSGALSAISVIWMFLPLWLGWLISVMWFLLLVMVGCDLYRYSFQILYQKCKEKLLDTLNRFMEHNLTEQQHVPV